MSEAVINENVRRWQEIDQLVRDWGGYSVYDDPYEAFQSGSILSPRCLNIDEWMKWKEEHYVGDSGYDHVSGKIINKKQRIFFDKWYPNWEDNYSNRDEEDEDDVVDETDDIVDASLNIWGGWIMQ